MGNSDPSKKCNPVALQWLAESSYKLYYRYRKGRSSLRSSYLCDCQAACCVFPPSTAPKPILLRTEHSYTQGKAAQITWQSEKPVRFLLVMMKGKGRFQTFSSLPLPSSGTVYWSLHPPKAISFWVSSQISSLSGLQFFISLFLPFLIISVYNLISLQVVLITICMEKMRNW